MGFFDFMFSKRNEQIFRLQSEVSNLQRLGFRYASVLKSIKDILGITPDLMITGDPVEYYGDILLRSIDFTGAIKDLKEAKEEETECGDRYYTMLNSIFCSVKDLDLYKDAKAHYAQNSPIPTNLNLIVKSIIQQLVADIEGLKEELKNLTISYQELEGRNQPLRDELDEAGMKEQATQARVEIGEPEKDKPKCECPPEYVCPKCREYKLGG